jgi:hypothetical protein
MTVEKCSSFCKGFAYFGLEYGKECYCGNVINASGQPVIDAECKFTCPGDKTQKCGAGDRLDVSTDSDLLYVITDSLQDVS